MHDASLLYITCSRDLLIIAQNLHASYFHMLRVSAKTAALVDKELMGAYGFSIDQLMELAGQAVSHAVYKIHPPAKGNKVLVLVGPGNNGGDGLVASRHLKLLGYKPSVYYPKHTKGELFERLNTQLKHLDIPFIEDIESEFKVADVIIDSLFGFSFKPPVREAFIPVMSLLTATEKPVLSVDIPSGWDVDNGPGDSKFMPTALISLTAPKECSKYLKGRHFIGGRFVDPSFANKYGFQVPPYSGTEQIYEVE